MKLSTPAQIWVALWGFSLAAALKQPLFPVHNRQTVGAGSNGTAGSGSSSLSALTASIKDIQTSIANANASLVPFKGGSIKGLIGLIAIDEGVVALGKNIDATTAIAQKTTTLSVQDSTTLGVQFLGVQPKITDLLSRLQTKRPEFDKAGFKILDVRSLIRDDLTGQQGKATELGTSLIKVLDPSLQNLATPINTQIQGNFTATIKAFQGRGGKIKIPAKAVPALSNLLADVGKALGIKAGDSKVASAAAAPDPATIAPATDAQLASSDAALADQAAQQAIDSTSDDDLINLTDDQNDLTGVPLPVLAVLKKYGII